METKLPETTPALLYSEAYKLCAAIRALNQVAYLHAEGGAVERMKKDLEGKAHALSIDMVTMWYKYDSYIRHIGETQVLARIEAGQIDHAIVKFPEHSRDILSVNDDGVELAIERTTGNKWRFCATTIDGQRPRLATSPRMVSIPLEDAEVFHTELKERNIQQLAGGAVCMGDDMAMERRIEAAIAAVKPRTGPVTFKERAQAALDRGGVLHENGIKDASGMTRVIFNINEPIGDPVMDPKVTRESPDNFTAAPVGQIATLTINEDTGHRVRRVNPSVPMPDGQYAVYGLNERPTTEQTKVATVVVYKGGIEQIIFNIAHGLPDGVYELVKP